jgi:hypothetical protein
MTQAILFQYVRHDRGGILPVNTFKFPAAHDANIFDETSRHLSDMIDSFFKEQLPQSYFWVEPAANFDQDEQESYGNVYSQLDRNDGIELPGEAYAAARALLVYILKSDYWLDFVDSVTPDLVEGMTLKDIPEIQVVQPEQAVLTSDPRFTIGETVIANTNASFIYRGVYVKPNGSNPNGSHQFVDQRTGVLIGVENNDFVNSRMVDEFLAAHTVEVHPLPRAISRGWFAGLEKPKWFALSKEFKRVEGFGRTQAEAKRTLATQALFLR